MTKRNKKVILCIDNILILIILLLSILPFTILTLSKYSTEIIPRVNYHISRPNHLFGYTDYNFNIYSNNETITQFSLWNTVLVEAENGLIIKYNDVDNIYVSYRKTIADKRMFVVIPNSGYAYIATESQIKTHMDNANKLLIQVREKYSEFIPQKEYKFLGL